MWVFRLCEWVGQKSMVRVDALVSNLWLPFYQSCVSYMSLYTNNTKGT